MQFSESQSSLWLRVRHPMSLLSLDFGNREKCAQVCRHLIVALARPNVENFALSINGRWATLSSFDHNNSLILLLHFY
jgi:hypothetical protein